MYVQHVVPNTKVKTSDDLSWVTIAPSKHIILGYDKYETWDGSERSSQQVVGVQHDVLIKVHKMFN